MSLNPKPETYPTGQESGGELCDMLILNVSAVKICKQCVQNASASGDFAPGPHWGTSVLQIPWAVAYQMKIPGAPNAYC